ncbi:hypothetical protein P4283_26015 [Bacillus thuringiensis]|nr:hypothetical protein [Bacillus thuringiensis]
MLQKIALSIFLDYKSGCDETKNHKKTVEKILEDLKNGAARKVVFTGDQGTEKGFLAYSMIHELNHYFWDISQEEESYYLIKSCLYAELESNL